MERNKIARNKDDWNSANYDLHIDLDEIPSNIPFKNITDLHEQLSKYSSICKNIHINISNENRNKRTDNFIITNKLMLSHDNGKTWSRLL